MWIIRTDRCVFRSSGSSAEYREDQTVTSVFAARVIWHLRRGPAQCELSQQVVPTRPRRRLARSSGDAPGLAGRLGIKPGQVVQEIGYDDDCDEQLRDEIDGLENVELVDEDYDDVVDVVLLWWRDGDGDLVDALVDALTPLADGGYIWLLTPKAGREGHVEPSDIGEAAP